jgi:hypothetical protein
MMKRGDNGVLRYVSRAGLELGGLHDLVAQALQDGSVSGGTELTGGQAARVRDAGIEFAPSAATPRQGVAAAEQSLIYLTVARAVRGGDPISRVARRLTATEQQITRVGSDKYLPEVANRCSPALLARIGDSSQKVPRRVDVAAARAELGLADAEIAAKGLRDLIIDVANREWSPSGVTPRQLAGTRTALDGTRKALTEFASATGEVGGAGGTQGGARGARMFRLGESYLPALHDLVLRVVAAELAQPSASGQEALRTARDRTSAMLKEWDVHVRAHGVSAQPSFATSGAGDALYVIDDDVASVREALLYQVKDEMWQLCGPSDLGALDVAAPVLSVRFASRLTMGALSGVPGGEPVWMSSGSFAGLLRLVPLHSWAYHSGWAKTDNSSTTEL